MKRTLVFGGGVAAAGLLAAGLVAPAQAAGDVKSTNLANTNFAAWQVINYWWGEKYSNFVNATPYNVETDVKRAKHISTGGPSADSKAGIVPAIGDEKKSGGTSKNVNLPRTTGKVFFRGADGKPHWCSATSVQSQYRNLVATAGHCVYDTVSNKATLDKWVFVPGYYQGKTPWGIYVGKTAYTHYDFDVYEDGDRNYAFVTVYNGVLPDGWDHKKRRMKIKDVGRLGDNVGGQGLAYNQKVGTNVFVFGYPSGSHPDGNHAYNGKTLKWTYGKTFAVQAPAIKGEELIGTKSSFTGQGAIGSSWLLQYKSARRIGYLNGVTIGVSDTDGNRRYDTSVSPYFDGETYSVYKAAVSNWSGKIA
ncbi:trypsin-like serine peptidase [Sphaerimonospora mesophila]|uniref:trypsin-like serine peptidase n=1 Tax=Sphaerimonospora mesophila TaxID=37483 RepID=UPI0006E1CCFA